MTAGDTYWWWTYWYGFEYDDGFDCRYEQDEVTGSEPADVADRTLHFSHANYSGANAAFSDTGFRDEGTLQLSQSGNSQAVCSGTSFTVTIQFTFPPSGTLFQHDDPRNQMITGSNHQFEWQTWNFKNIDSSSGTGSIELKVFRHSQNSNFADYVDMILSGGNPPGLTGSFTGKGRLHLVCP